LRRAALGLDLTTLDLTTLGLGLTNTIGLGLTAALELGLTKTLGLATALSLRFTADSTLILTVALGLITAFEVSIPIRSRINQKEVVEIKSFSLFAAASKFGLTIPNGISYNKGIRL